MKQRTPVADVALPERAGAGVPRAMPPIQHPPPLRCGTEAGPDGPTEGSGQVGARRVHADHEIELHHRCGGVTPVLQLGPEIVDTVSEGGHLLAALAELQAVEGDAGQTEYRRP
jgi:hypothetical protein